MSDLTSGTSSTGSSQTSSSSKKSTTTATSRRLPQVFEDQLFSQSECADLQNNVLQIGSLDLYFLNVCAHYGKDQNAQLDLISITCDDMDEAGVTLDFQRTPFEERTACPSRQDYYITSQMVSISFNLRNGWADPRIRQLIFPGQVSQFNSKNVYEIRKQDLYKKLDRYIVSAVPLGADPDPSVSGGFLFPYVTLDPNTNTTLNYNPDSSLLVNVSFMAQYQPGQNGALALIYE